MLTNNNNINNSFFSKLYYIRYLNTFLLSYQSNKKKVGVIKGIIEDYVNKKLLFNLNYLIIKTIFSSFYMRMRSL